MSNSMIRNLYVLVLLSKTDQNHPVTVDHLHHRLSNQDLNISPRQLQRDLVTLSRYFNITNDVGDHRKYLWFSCAGGDMNLFKKQSV